MAQETNKWMGIDFGLARIGLAVSDPLGLLARGLETLTWNGKDVPAVLDRLVACIEAENVAGVVMGCPNRTDGRKSLLADQVEAVAQSLRERLSIPVELRDERFTTALAARKLREQAINSKKQRRIIDQVAAEIILQEHLDSRRERAYDKL